MYQAVYYDRQRGGMVHLWDDTEGYKKFRNSKYAFKIDPKGEYTTLYGDKATLVKKWEEEEIEDGLIYESDVRTETRVLIDKYLFEEPRKPVHRIMYLDIEVEKDGAYSTVQEAKNRVTAITINQEDTEKILLLSDTIQSRKTDKYELLVYKDEEELLKYFIFFIRSLDPTIISGWNVSGYDIPYLVNRMKNLNIEYTRLSEIGIVDETRSSFSKNPDDTEWIIAGRNVIDYLYIYKKFTPNEESNYKLDTIAKKIVHRGKVEFEGSLQNLYETDLEKFIEYNREDVQLVKDIDSKLLYIDLVIDLSTTCFCNYSDIYQSSFLIDGASLAYLRKKGIVSPNKRYTGGEAEKSIEGAYVKLPIPGLYRWIFDLDLKALYPSIMRSLNISPETKVGKILNWNQEEHTENKIETYELQLQDKTIFYSRKELLQFFEDEKIAIGTNGVMFTTSKKGFVPEILEVWDSERDFHKAEMKRCHSEGNEEGKMIHHIKQYTLKIISNTFYGVLLLRSFRYGDWASGECITLSGQSVISHSSKMANLYFNKKLNTNKDYVIYMDTDSLFLSVEPLIDNITKLTDEELILKTLDYTSDIQRIINKSYDIYAKKYHNIDNHCLSIKQELIGRSGIWLPSSDSEKGAKKRYAIWIINKEGMAVDEIEFKGVDVVRSNFPSAARIFMTNLITDILKGEPKNTIEENIHTLYQEYKLNDIKTIMLPTGVKEMSKYKPSSKTFGKFNLKTPAHVKAAHTYNLMLKQLKQDNYPKLNDGDKILWTYLKTNKYQLNTIGIPVEEVSPEIQDFIEKHIDRKKLFETSLIKKIEPFFKTMKWGEVTTEPKHNFF